MSDELSSSVWLVDDEAPVRDLIRSSVKWADHHLELEYAFQRSDQVLKRLNDHSAPSILLSDILMPGMDGIELAEYMRDRHPETVVVLITGYERFEFARKAIQAQVFTLLLKPVESAELSKTLRAARAEYVRRVKKENRYPVADHLRSLVLQDHLRGNDAEYPNLETLLQIGTDQDTYQVLLWPNPKNVEVEKRRLKERGLNICTFEVGNEIIGICRNPQPNLILHGLSDAPGFSGICAGGIRTGFKGLRRSYGEALRVLSEQRRDQSHQSVSSVQETENLNLLDFFVSMGNTNKVQETLKVLFDSTTTVRMTAIRIVSRITDLLPEINLPDRVVRIDGGRSIAEEILELDSDEKIRRITSELTTHITTLAACRSGDSEDTGFGRIREYVERNYSRADLSLGHLSDVFGLNTSSISRAFHRQVGCTFKKFVIRLRLQKAIDLMQTQDLPAYQIAERVGFPESHYFSTCFKKHMGVSIREYRQSLQST